MRGFKATALGVLGLLAVAGCKRGEIDQKSVASQSGIPILGIAPFSVVENSNNSFLFTLTQAVKKDTTFTWVVSSLAAPTTGRFSASSGSITLRAGATTARALIPLIDDAIYQGDVEYRLTLFDVPPEIQVPIKEITFTLIDDESVPVVQFASAGLTKAEAAASSAAEVTLSPVSAYPTTVTFAVAGTATPGDDYTTNAARAVTFAPGESSKTIGITVMDDYLPEPDETVVLSLDAVTAGRATIGPGRTSFTLTVQNDDFAPVILDVSSARANGGYHAGTIPITVKFTRPVNVTGTPTLTLATGSNGRVASYARGGGTANLVFDYVIQPGDVTNDLDYVATTSLNLNGGTIKSSPDALDALLVLPAPGSSGSLGFNKDLLIDTVAPVITNVTSGTPNGAYPVGTTITVFVAFSEPVYATGAPTLWLETGATDHAATYAGGSGGTTLSFTYVVRAGDTTSDLDAQSAAALLLNGGSLNDGAGNPATLTVPIGPAAGSLASNKNIVFDTTVPTVLGVTSSLGSGEYPVGTVVPVQIIFSEPVFVTGTPRLTLETGASDADVAYTGGSGGTTLTFTYTVRAGDAAHPLDVTSASALVLGDGAIVDGATNAADLTLPAPGASGSLGLARTIVIDTAGPIVSRVTSSTANGVYPVGSVINVQVVFDEVVVTYGTPTLTLETGVVDRVVEYVAGSGSNVLNFSYVVRAGDTSLDLDVTSTAALALNGGSIKDSAGNDAALTLPAPGTGSSLSANKNLVIDTTAPRVNRVTSSKQNGAYSTGTTIDVAVNFTESVTVTGVPRLVLSTGAGTTTLDYMNGSGGNALTFRYVVASGDASEDLDYATTTALSLNGGSILDAARNAAVLNLPAPGASESLGANKDLVIDTMSPTVIDVSSTLADGAYAAGTLIPVTVQFSESVTVTGTPTLTLETGAVDRDVSYASGSGTTTLTFAYVVRAGDTAAHLDYVDAASLGLNGAAIVDRASNAANLGLSSPGGTGSLGANKSLVVDTTAPAIVSLNSPTPDGSYRGGRSIDVVVHFTEIVNVTGTPQLTLETGMSDAVVDYFGGSGTSDLTFRYVVRAGDTSPDLEVTGTTALNLNGGAIFDPASNAATLTLPAPGAVNSLGANRDFIIDTTAPSVTRVTSTTPDGNYPAGSSINVRIIFSELVYVTGTPRLTVETGATDRVVAYANGSGGNALNFTYVVQAGDTAADLDVISSAALALNGGAITDAAINAADLTLPAPGAVNSLSANKNIVIDTTSPTVTSVTSTRANGAYRAGAIIDVVVNFSENVIVGGVPQLTLRTGAGTTTLDYQGGSGGGALTFRYVVAAGDASEDLDYAGATSLRLNGGSVVDAATNAADLTLPAPGAPGSLGANKDLIVDTAAPTVVNVSSTTPNGSYPAGTVIPIVVSFSENVTVTGSPLLTLETGTTDRDATFASGSGSNVLTFNYTVRPGDASADLDYVGTSALKLNGGTIVDRAVNAALTTLPSPGATNSLGANRNIVIDTTVPFILSVNSSTPDGYFRAGTGIDVVVHFSEPVVVTGTPRLTLETGASDAVVDYSGGSGSADLVFHYVVRAGDTSPDLDTTGTTSLALNGGTINDPASNAATLTLPTPGAAGSLGSNRNLVVDTTAPTAPGAVNDGTWVTSTAQTPPASWGASTDATSGVDHYDFAIGTSAGGTETLNWISNGASLTRTQYSLTLTEGTYYYVSVRAVDRAGNVSNVSSGDGFRADATMPSTPASLDDGLTSSSTSQTPLLTWSAATDALSGLARFEIAVGSGAGLADVLTWTDVGNVLTKTLSLSLSEGSTYYASVRAVDVAGNIGLPRAADGWVIGWLPEAYVKAAGATTKFGSSVAISGNTMVVGYTSGAGGAYVYHREGATWSQQANLTAGDGESGDAFGSAVAISGDTIVIGAPGEDASANTIATSTSLIPNNLATDSGAVYIFTRSGTTWSLQAFAKASNNASGIAYGSSVAISADTVVVGAPSEASNATGTSTTASTNTSNANAGAAYVLSRSGTTWTQQSYLKSATPKAGVKFGSSVAVNVDTVVIGAPNDNSSATAITNGTGGGAGTGSTNAGAAYVFKRGGTTWQQEAFVKPSNNDAGDYFGYAVAVAGDTVVVGAPAEASGQRGVTNGTSASTNNGSANAGAAYVFGRAGSSWSQAAYLKSANADPNDYFGGAVATDGNLILVSAPGESSAQTTVGQLAAASADNSAGQAGAGYLFRGNGANYGELAYLKAPNAGGGDQFGLAVAISGSTLALGAPLEDSNQTTITNGQTASSNNSATDSGAVYLFNR